MATPNLVNVTTINGFTIAGAVTTSNADIIDVAADKLRKINSIIVANIDGTNSATVTVSISVDNGSNYKTADYRTAGFYTEYNGSAANTATLSTGDYFMWATAVANQATHTLNGHIWLMNPSNSATFPQAYAEIGHYAEDDYSRRMIQHGVWSGGATAFNNIKFAPSASVFNEGKFVLYGVKNS